MTMHLLPVYFNDLKSNKKKKTQLDPLHVRRFTPKQKIDFAKLKHEQFIHKMTKGQKADKEYLAKKWKTEYANDIAVDRSDYVSAGMESGNCSKQEPKVYTGGNLVGIATMHKSNMVPIFAENKEAAVDIAKMRR